MKYLLTTIAFLISPLNLFSQDTPVTAPSIQLNATQVAALDEAKKLNIKVVELYNQQKYGDAVKAANQIPALIETNGLVDNQAALAILTSVGEVLLIKGKESDAIALFEIVLKAYERKLGENSVPVTVVTEKIARAYLNKSDHGKAERYGLKFVALAEKAYGPESKKLAKAYSFLGDI